MQSHAENDKETNTWREKENENNANEACSFKYSELVAATQNFREDNLIGEGGFGGVYKGLLESGQVFQLFYMYFTVSYIAHCTNLM